MYRFSSALQGARVLAVEESPFWQWDLRKSSSSPRDATESLLRMRGQGAQSSLKGTVGYQSEWQPPTDLVDAWARERQKQPSRPLEHSGDFDIGDMRRTECQCSTGSAIFGRQQLDIVRAGCELRCSKAARQRCKVESVQVDMRARRTVDSSPSPRHNAHDSRFARHRHAETHVTGKRWWSTISTWDSILLVPRRESEQIVSSRAEFGK
jgi:hypothetical protein